MSKTFTIDALRGAGGRFSMLAIDQRESLRGMLKRGSGESITDERLVQFKVMVAKTLSRHASAVLLDREFGGEAARVAECPVILAADTVFASSPGGPIDQARLDTAITADVVAAFGATALKMLVPWTPDSRPQAVELSASFLDLCRSVERPGVVEGVVRVPGIEGWSDRERNDALVEAAKDLGSTHPDLYKADVPQFGAGNPEGIVETARRITEVLECPWVVLSSGVPADAFPAAVALCARGGASGFLAGRAIWADATAVADPLPTLEAVSVQRLTALTHG